jgi:hypothetical protein
MTTEVTYWKCDWCDFCDDKKEVAVRHEKRCIWNPVHKGCRTCVKYSHEFNTCGRAYLYDDYGGTAVNCIDWVPVTGEDRR